MKKLLFLAFAFTSVLGAQLTTITDTLKNAQRRVVSGSLTITWQPFTAVDGVEIAAGKVIVPVVNGVFTVQLSPNDTAEPANTSYTVTYSIFNYSRGPETWVVPTSSTPLNIAGVLAASPPPAPVSLFMILPSQIKGTGALVGQVPTWDGAETVWSTPGSVGTPVTNETATAVSGGWTLAHTPASRPTCYLNGLRLAGGSADFTIAGNAISSSYWSAVVDSSDVLTCDYTY